MMQEFVKEQNNISTHTPLAGRDHTDKTEWGGRIRFLLTRPLRDVTFATICGFDDITISTHTPLAGRDASDARDAAKQAISTHTPLAGRDTYVKAALNELGFLLTRPLRDVTTTFCIYTVEHPHILERTCF